MIKIVTHPGSAHKDDFLAASVLLARLDGARLLRREPSREDLDDPETYVIDVGMEHDPARRNFDHHQDPTLPCAFHLVMQHLGLHEAAQEVFAWYPYMSMMDVRGPHRTAEHLGVQTDLLFATSSPIEGYMLSLFAGRGVLDEQDSLYRFMRNLGRDMIALIDEKTARLERLRTESRLLPVPPYKAVFSTIEESPKLAMEIFLRRLDDPEVVMLITPSNRGIGWELLRIGDHPDVDFRRLKGRTEIRFVHGNGFLAKTHRRLPLEELLVLARDAIAA